MSNGELVKFIIDARQLLLTYGNRENMKFPTNSNKYQHLIGIVGKKGVGKSFFISLLNRNEFLFENDSIPIIEDTTNEEGKDTIFEKAIILIVIVNSLGLLEQKYISSLYERKREDAVMLVILNYSTTKSYEKIFEVTNGINLLFKTKFLIDNDHCYWNDNRGICYYLMINHQSKSHYSNNVIRQKIIEFISESFGLLFFRQKRIENNNNIKRRHQPEYRYYVKENNQFFIDIELCGKIRSIKVDIELKENIVHFNICGEKASNEQMINNQIQYEKFELKISVLYEIATLRDFTQCKHSLKDGVLTLCFDTLDKSINMIN